MLVPWFASPAINTKGRTDEAVVNLSYSVVNVSKDLDDLFRVPHGMLVFAVFTPLALLAVQFKHDIAHIGGIVQLEPKDDPALHRRPSVATLLT